MYLLEGANKMLEDFKVVTPLIKLNSFKNNETYIKLEGSNLYGSAKDRAAVYVLSKLFEEGTINRDTEIVESSSGNMGVALAAVGARLKLNITLMIDESISSLNEFLIKSYGAKTIKITEADENGSYLKKRLQTVREYIAERDNVYWFNQYGNPLVVEAYKETVGKEIVQQCPDADYVFIAVSSGGTVAGISQKIHEYNKSHNKSIKVIAVDVEGSKISDPQTKKIKHFTGIGSSIRTDNFLRVIIDGKIIVSEHDSMQALFNMMRKEQLFLGGSSGCVVTGTEQYLELHQITKKKIVIVSHDCGDSYFANLYSKHMEFMNLDMSLERLYYNDPFSNIVISCDIFCEESSELLSRVLKTTIEEFELLGVSISVDSNLKYCNVEHNRNIDNILFSNQDEFIILKSLVEHPFDLQNGETLKIVVQTKEFGYTMYFCMHHIIGDANSLILLIKKFLARMQSNNICVVENKNTSQNQIVELDAQCKYLISTINRQYPRKQYSRNEYLSMHSQVYSNNNLEISILILNEREFREMKDFCKKHAVSISSYIVSELFRMQNVDTVRLAVDTRETETLFGNFVSRIDISRGSVEKESDIDSRVTIINKQIKGVLENKSELVKSEEMLNQIHPEFYDDVIFSVYADESNLFARKMSKFIGFKDNRPTTFVSNLKTVNLGFETNLKISNLCFYPPHPMERTSTIGIVTQHDQMIITIQKFRKEKTL